MATDARADDEATESVREVIGGLVGALSKAVFGVCSVAVGALILLVAAGNTTDESSVFFLTLGIATMLVGVVTISRLPKPNSASPVGSHGASSQPDDRRQND